MATKKRLKISLFCMVLSLSILLSATAFADTVPGGANITQDTDQGSYPTPIPQSANFTGGNISLINLSTEMSTVRWVGLFGNVSGTINLGDSGNNVLYRWQAQGRYVFASISNAIDWANLAPATVPNVLAVYPFLANGTDNYTTTFTNTGDIDSEIIGPIANIDYALTLNVSGDDFWETYALEDSDADIIFMGAVNATGAPAYNGLDVNYQMIIPENGVLNSIPTEYYLWVELT